MRFLAAYYLLLIYLTVMLKPLVPVCMDSFAHAFAEANHFATIHAVYGANHLEKDIADVQPANSGNKDQQTLSQKCDVPFHICILAGSNIMISYQQPPAYPLFTTAASINVIIPPNKRPPRFWHVSILHKD